MQVERELVGRGRELRALARLEEAGARLVTIVGPAGGGKSRRAGAVAERGAPRGEALWCDLAGARSTTDVCGVLAAALGVRLSSPGSPADALGDALAALGEHLVVLDNLEDW